MNHRAPWLVLDADAALAAVLADAVGELHAGVSGLIQIRSADDATRQALATICTVAERHGTRVVRWPSTDPMPWHELDVLMGAAAGQGTAVLVVAEALGHPPEFITSVSGYTSRKTDRRTLEIFEMVYCGKNNKGIVERLQRQGVNALGLSGLDGRLLAGKRKKALKAVHRRCADVRFLGSWPTGSATGTVPPQLDEAEQWLGRLRRGTP